MEKAELSDLILTLDNHYQAMAETLVVRLKRVLPEQSLIALDCVPNGKLNAFHYVDGKHDAKRLLELFKLHHLPTATLELQIEEAQSFKIDYEAGVDIELWEKLEFSSFEKVIDWQESFVIKKPSGEMKIFDPMLERKKAKGKIKSQDINLAGAVTRYEMLRFLHKLGANYYQPYLPPLAGPKDPCRNTTYRLLINRNGNSIQFIGGLWVSGNSLRLKNESQIRSGLIISA